MVNFLSARPERRRRRSGRTLAISVSGAVIAGAVFAPGAWAVEGSPTSANAVAAPSTADFPANPLEKPGWVLDRHDEFTGTTLDSGLWIDNYLESRTTEERSRARYELRDGTLVLKIEDDQPTYYASGRALKVSSVQTGQRTGLHKADAFDHAIPTEMKYAPLYGYFEIRARTTPKSGLHSAWWTTGVQETPEQSAEIDIIEDPGNDPNKFLFNLHKQDDPATIESGNTITTAADVTSGMHIYGLEWSPDQLKLYVDNVLVKTINDAPAYRSLFYLSLYENAGWTGTVNPADTRPKEFVIDYFRAYTKSPPAIAEGTYRVKNVMTGKYLDTDPNHAVTLATSTTSADQKWAIQRQPGGNWTLDNLQSGRAFLDTDDSAVVWNTGWIGDDSRWILEPVGTGFRILNERPGRGYLQGSTGGAVGLTTTASQDSIWMLEQQ